MSLLDAFTSGAVGIDLTLPEDLDVLEDGEADVFLGDTVRGLVIGLSVSPASLALDTGWPERVHAAARHAFDERARRAGDDAYRRRRTKDNSWSPVISAATLSLPGGPAGLALVREAYQLGGADHPGEELVAAYLLIPVAGGTAQLSLAAHRASAGAREQAQLGALLQPRGGIAPAAGFPGGLTQADIDHPSLDAQDPAHPLSRVRAGLSLLRPSLNVHAPASPPTPNLTLPDGSGLMLPAGYTPVPLAPPAAPVPAPIAVAAVSIAHRLVSTSTLTLVRYPERLSWLFSDSSLRRFVQADAAASGQEHVELHPAPRGLLTRSVDAHGIRHTRWFMDGTRRIHSLILHKGWLSEEEALVRLNQCLAQWFEPA